MNTMEECKTHVPAGHKDAADINVTRHADDTTDTDGVDTPSATACASAPEFKGYSLVFDELRKVICPDKL